MEDYLNSSTLPVRKPSHYNSHKTVAEIHYPLNNTMDKNNLYTTQTGSYGNHSSRRQKSPSRSVHDLSDYYKVKNDWKIPRSDGKIPGSDRKIPGSYGLRDPSYSTIAMLSTQRTNSDVTSVAAPTVADLETVGDELSLGEEDYELQPTSVRDRRLRNVARGVERLLNEQLMQPVNRGHKHQADIHNW